MPGAESSVSMEPAYFTGVISAWETGAVEVESLPDRTIETWPVAWRNITSEPRINGEGEAMDYLETIRSPDGSGIRTHTGVGRLTNDEGSFAVECQGAGAVLEDQGGGVFCWYEGEGSYDGLTAFMIMTESGAGLDVEGWIYPGERPPLLDFEP